MDAPDPIQSHADALRISGYTVLEERLPAALLRRLQSRFAELLAAKAAAEETNRGPQRYQMYLPWEPPFAEPLLYAHETVLPLAEALLGPDPALVYLASDTPLPGSAYQRVHSDTRLLFPDTTLSLPAYGLVLNVPLVDCSEENGSLEFWPGTHLMPGKMDLERLSEHMPSLRANLPAGALLVRDLRMWHRGTPNRSSAPRPHLALVYVRPWYRFEQQVPVVPRAAWEALPEAHQRLLRYARITD